MWSLLLTTMFMLAQPAQPRAANCVQARTEAERAICQTPALRALDRKMNAAFGRMLSLIGSTEGQRAFRANQKAWLADRDRCGSTVLCLSETMTQRLAWIEAPLNSVSGLYSNGAYAVLVTMNDQSMRPIVRLYTGKGVSERGLLLMEADARWVEPSDPTGEGEPAVVFRPIFLGPNRALEKQCTKLRLTFFMDDLLSVQGEFKGEQQCPWLQQQGKAAGQNDYKLVRPVYDYIGPVR